jgi:hypothetical protein
MPSNIPTMRNLMEDPLFRAYMKRVPPRHQANLTGEPWQLWVRSEGGKWLTRTYTSYQEVWPIFVSRFRLPDQDPTITSRRLFYAPPGEWYTVKVRLSKPTPSGTTHRVEQRWRQLFFWDGSDLNWCGRCRRPVFWQPLHSQHHALRRMPAVTEEDNYRCGICGIRWIATPSIEQMTKMEPRA